MQTDAAIRAAMHKARDWTAAGPARKPGILRYEVESESADACICWCWTLEDAQRIADALNAQPRDALAKAENIHEPHGLLLQFAKACDPTGKRSHDEHVRVALEMQDDVERQAEPKPQATEGTS